MKKLLFGITALVLTPASSACAAGEPVGQRKNEAKVRKRCVTARKDVSWL